MSMENIVLITLIHMAARSHALTTTTNVPLELIQIIVRNNQHVPLVQRIITTSAVPKLQTAQLYAKPPKLSVELLEKMIMAVHSHLFVLYKKGIITENFVLYIVLVYVTNIRSCV